MNSNVISSVVAILIIASCAGLSTAQWTPDPFCPFPSDHVTRYPYYGNCSIYWECYNGAKYVMACPEGLEFNAPYQRCDAPEIAKCDPFASTTANPNPPTYTTGPTGRTTSSNGPDPMCPYPSEELVYFPYPGDCTKYWECYEGNKYLQTCPAGLWWHEEISECDYPGSFCDNTTSVAPPTTAPPTTAPPTTAPPTTAPPTTAPPTTARPTTAAPSTSSPSPTTGPKPICPNPPPEEPVYFPVPGDCTKYWECSNGKEYINTCPSGLWWHQEIAECDYPGSFCDNTTTIASTPTTAPPTTAPPTTAPPTTAPPTTAPPTTARPTTAAPTTAKSTTSYPVPTTGRPPICPETPTDEPVYFPYVGDCTKYWECSNGKEYENTCPSGLWWHQEISECDYPGTFCDPSPICPEIPTEKPIFFPYVGDCTKYWECSDGTLYEYKCPSGLWWHQEISECDYPGSFCDNSTTVKPTTRRPTTVTVVPPTTDTPVFICNGTATSYWPHPSSCHRYIECLNGDPFVVDCPPNLYFSDNIKECVSDEKSECCKVHEC